MKKVMEKVKNFFIEMFKDDVGVNRPGANKPTLKWTMYFLIGIILSYVFPTCLVYLEAWQFKWNVFAIVWGKGTNYVYRAYFPLFWCGNLGFLCLGYLNPYHINGNSNLIGCKQSVRFLVGICFAIGIACFIIANLLY